MLVRLPGPGPIVPTRPPAAAATCGDADAPVATSPVANELLIAAPGTALPSRPPTCAFAPVTLAEELESVIEPALSPTRPPAMANPLGVMLPVETCPDDDEWITAPPRLPARAPTIDPSGPCTWAPTRVTSSSTPADPTAPNSPTTPVVGVPRADCGTRFWSTMARFEIALPRPVNTPANGVLARLAI